MSLKLIKLGQQYSDPSRIIIVPERTTSSNSRYHHPNNQQQQQQWNLDSTQQGTSSRCSSSNSLLFGNEIGYPDATRLDDFLRNDSFLQNLKVRFLNKKIYVSFFLLIKRITYNISLICISFRHALNPL